MAERSDFVDQFVSAYFTMPVSMSWQKAQGLPIPDTYLGARLSFAGLATAWLNLDTMTLAADRLRFVPELPVKLQVSGATAELTIGQKEVDRWLKRFNLPFKLELAADGIRVVNEIAGLPLGDFKTELDVVNGWFMLKPKAASFMGVPGWVSELFKSYLPLPPLGDDARLQNIQHAAGKLTLTMSLADFEEPVTPGLMARLQRRIFPSLTLPGTP